MVSPGLRPAKPPGRPAVLLRAPRAPPVHSDPVSPSPVCMLWQRTNSSGQSVFLARIARPVRGARAPGSVYRNAGSLRGQWCRICGLCCRPGSSPRAGGTGGALPCRARCRPARRSPVMPRMPQFDIETFRAPVMIVASSGRYLPVSGHDHETARAGASLSSPVVPAAADHTVNVASITTRRADLASWLWDLDETSLLCRLRQPRTTSPPPRQEPSVRSPWSLSRDRRIGPPLHHVNTPGPSGRHARAGPGCLRQSGTPPRKPRGPGARTP
jgi:hypothetical protein